MSNTRGLSPEHTDWEDKYRRLYEKHQELNGKCNEKDDTIKKLQTKIRKLESEFTQLERLKSGEALPRAPKLSREDEELVPSLYDQINKLKSQIAILNDKNKELSDVLEKKKRELAVSKKVLQSKKATPAPKEVLQSPTGIEIRPGPTKHTTQVAVSQPVVHEQPNQANSLPPDPNLLELAKKYKARLATAEEQLLKLREENLKLQGLSKVHTNDNSSDLEAKLRDTSWRLQQLQTQYDYLASKSATQSNSTKSYESQLEDYAKKVRDLRRALEDLRYEKDVSDTKAERVSELQDQVLELKQTNRNLEEKIARLCETPFISDQFKKHEAQLHYDEIVKERETLLSKVDHLQEAVRTNYSALTTLKHDIVKLRNENQELSKANEEMRLKYSELEVNSNVLESKLKLYSGDDGIDLESLEKALTLVKRRSDAPNRLPFLEPVGDTDSMITLPAYKKKLEDVQIINIKLSEDIEKLENMLRLQTNINRDLHSELELIVRKRESDVSDLKVSIADLESMNKKRLQKIQSLEAQLRQYIYNSAKKKGGKPQPGVNLDEVESNDGADTVLLNEFISEKNGMVNSDENLLQVWCKSGEFKEGVIKPGSSTFIVVDFFDFESQATALQVGSKPRWDCAVTFKINVDDFLLRFLATEVIVLEINMAIGGDFTLLSRAAVPLSSLLRIKPTVHLVNHPLLSLDTGELIGYINVDMRLALPVSELYRLYLERNPSEKRLINEIATRRIIDSSNAIEQARLINEVKLHSGSDSAEETRLYNEIEVSIIQAKNLPLGKTGKAPSSYVYFQMLSFPDKFTNPVPYSTDPQYNEKFTYPMYTNDQSIRLLRTSRLIVTVIDMNSEESGDKDDGLIGEIAISLVDLSTGNPLSSFFSIKTSNGDRVGEIEIGVKWKYAFKQQRELGPRALSNMEVELLISSFCAEGYLVSDGIVDFKAFCRVMNPPQNINRTIDLIRNYALKVMEAKKQNDHFHGSAYDIFRVILSKSNDEVQNPNYSEDHFIEKMRTIQLDILPSDYLDLFSFIDSDANKVISLDQLVSCLSLDDNLGVPISLQIKLRQRASELQAIGVDPLKIFEQSALNFGSQGRFMSRLEFKKCLSNLGFNLVDESDELFLSKVGNQRFLNHVEEKSLKVNKLTEDNDGLDDSYGSLDDTLKSYDENQYKHRQHDKSQREIFESRRQEIESLKVKPGSASNQPVLSQNNQNISTHVGLNILDKSNENIVHESVSKLNPSSNPNQSFDKTILDDLATKVQSHYRGHAVRKSIDSSTSLPVRQMASTPTARQHKQGDDLPKLSDDMSSPQHLLAAENIIRECYKIIEGHQSPPNVLAGFQTVDKKKTGYVNRAQFAHVLKQFPVIKLYGIELRACMDFFDTEKDGGHIDYKAFCKFLNFRIGNWLSSVDALHHSISFSMNQLAALKSMDKTGSGQLTRMEIVRYFNQMGFNHLSQPVIGEICDLFETSEPGLVNYLNMIEFISENDLTNASKELENKLFELFESKGDASSDQVLRHWFKLIEGEGIISNGQFTIQQFHHFLKIFNISASKSCVLTVFSVLDEDGSGEVSYSNLLRWVKQQRIKLGLDKSNIVTPAIFTYLGLSEIQKKVSKYFLLLANAGQGRYMNLIDVSKSFEIYDITNGKAEDKHSGYIHRDFFESSLLRCGFILTKSERGSLIKEFSVPNKNDFINYRKFLEWGSSIPTSNINANSNDLKTNNSSTAIMKYLETAINRGIDLLSLFGRYDTQSTGRIESNDFCAALSDLGLSSVTQSEAISLSERFKAVVGNFILYRKIVTELLHHADDVSGAENVDVIDIIRSAMVQKNINYSRLREVFEYYDRKGQGRVHEDDVKLIFEDANIRLNQRVIESICDKYSMSGASGWISYGGILKALEYRIPKSSKPSSADVKIIPEDLLLKVNKLIENLIIRGIDYRNEFDRCDETFVGSISKSDFADVLQDRYKAGLSVREIEFIETKYADPRDHRRILHGKFLYEFNPRFSIAHHNNTESSDHLINDVADKLRNKIRRRCDYSNPSDLKKPYHHFARNKSKPNQVTLRDFSVAIKELGIKLSSDIEEGLFEVICVSGHRNDNDEKYFNFLDFVVFVSDPFHNDVVWKFKRSLTRSRVSSKELIDSLKEYDKNYSGLISYKQFEKAIRLCDVELSESDITRLFTRFDSDNSQKLNIALFSNFLLGKKNGFDHNDDPEASPIRKSITSIKSHDSIEDGESVTFNYLKRAIEKKLDDGFTSNEVFALFDVDRKGVLDLASMQLGVRELGLTFSRSDVRSVLRRLSLLINGPVDKSGLFTALKIDTSSDRIPKDSNRSPRRKREFDNDRDDYPLTKSREKYKDQGEFEGIIEKVREMANHLVQVGDYSTGIEVLKNAFQDRKTVTMQEFNGGLKDVAIRLNRLDVVKIFDIMDPDLLGNISTESFIRKVYPNSFSVSESSQIKTNEEEAMAVFRKRPDLRDVLVRQFEQIVKTERRSITEFEDILKSCDRYNRGKIERGDFIKCMTKFGISLRSSEERDISDSFAEDKGRGEIDYKGFIIALKLELKSLSIASDALTSLYSKIKRELGDDNSSLEQAFEQIDRKGTGRLDVDDFEDALKRFKISLSREEAKRIVSEFSSDGHAVKYREFVKNLKGRSEYENISESKDSGSRNAFNDETWETLRSCLLEEFGSMTTIRNRLKEIFLRVDFNRDGAISERDFSNVFADLKLRLKSSDLRKIFQSMDSRDSGFINYNEFIKIVESKPTESMSGRNSNQVDELIGRVRSKLEDEYGSRSNVTRRLKDIFTRIDYSGDGKLSERELASAFDDLKLRFSELETRKIFQHIDSDRSGYINYNEFIKLVDSDLASVSSKR